MAGCAQPPETEIERVQQEVLLNLAAPSFSVPALKGLILHEIADLSPFDLHPWHVEEFVDDLVAGEFVFPYDLGLPSPLCPFGVPVTGAP